jgi:hypothetical protein
VPSDQAGGNLRIVQGSEGVKEKSQGAGEGAKFTLHASGCINQLTEHAR